MPSPLSLEIKTAIFLLCNVNIFNGQNNHSSKFAGDCCFVTRSCMLIGRDYSSLCKRLTFLQGSSSSSWLRQVPNLCGFCFHHLGFCCCVIPCNVLDFIILGLDDSGSPAVQITRPQYKFFFFFYSLLNANASPPCLVFWAIFRIHPLQLHRVFVIHIFIPVWIQCQLNMFLFLHPNDLTFK